MPIIRLQFEWAWQHPHASRRLRHVPRKRPRQKNFDFRLMVLSEMLKVGPWCRLPLTVRWLDREFSQDYANHLSPPLHMPICYGKVASRKVYKSIKQDLETSNIWDDDIIPFCSLCDLALDKEEAITCLKPSCLLAAHMICLAKLFCKDKMILPVEGTCPVCRTNVLWGDLIKKKIGCYRDLQENSDASNSDFEEET
ncbi:hypothetical protein KM043_013999 [Ampulex compressa]|nr:hypothetical protein KM043_013999 [Ampulex compressa]